MKATVSGADRLRRIIRESSEPASNSVEKALLDGGKKVESDARSSCPSRKIARSIGTRLIKSGKKDATVEVGSKLFYAKFIELGTAPHEIKPDKKKVLSWKPIGATGIFRGNNGKLVAKKYYQKSDGSATFDSNDVRIASKIVHHPGATAKPFLYPAYQKNRGTIKKLVANAMATTISKAAKR